MDDYAGSFEDTRKDVTRRTATAADHSNDLNCLSFSRYKMHITNLSNIYNTVLDTAHDVHGPSVGRCVVVTRRRMANAVCLSFDDGGNTLH